MIWRVLYLYRKGGYLSQGETGSHSVSVPTSSSCVSIGNGQYRDATKPGAGLLCGFRLNKTRRWIIQWIRGRWVTADGSSKFSGQWCSLYSQMMSSSTPVGLMGGGMELWLGCGSTF